MKIDVDATVQTLPRVVVVISTFYPFVGGGETHALLLGKALAKRGCRVIVITRRTSRELPARETVQGLPVVRVPPVGFKRWSKYLMLSPVLRELRRSQNDYDLIFVSGLRILGIAGMLASRRLGKPCVLRAASCGELSGGYIWDSPHKTAMRRNLLKFVLKPMMRWRNRLFLKAANFLAISSAIADEYRACGVPEDKITVINNGTDTDLFSPAMPPEKKDMRKRLGLPDAFTFCYSGKLNRGKGLEFLLRVWVRLIQRHPEARLILVGSGGQQFLSCEDELRAFTRANGCADSVIFTGYVKNVHDYLKAGDVFVFPSENESLSNALIEACACGLPCLASRIGGIPDTIRDGYNGRLLSSGDEDAWLSAMEHALLHREDVATWGRKARERALEHNSIEAVATQHLALFASLLRTK